ncbi:hypothetical protein V8C44DRAFT_344739 [Trichoderma aethiopicum]
MTDGGCILSVSSVCVAVVQAAVKQVWRPAPRMGSHQPHLDPTEIFNELKNIDTIISDRPPAFILESLSSWRNDLPYNSKTGNVLPPSSYYGTVSDISLDRDAGSDWPCQRDCRIVSQQLQRFPSFSEPQTCSGANAVKCIHWEGRLEVCLSLHKPSGLNCPSPAPRRVVPLVEEENIPMFVQLQLSITVEACRVVSCRGRVESLEGCKHSNLTCCGK